MVNLTVPLNRLPISDAPVGDQAAAWLNQSYNASAPGYDAAFGSVQCAKYRAMLAGPDVKRRLSRRVLDLGCGTGLLREFASIEFGFADHQLAGWVGLDFAEQMLVHARAKGLEVLRADIAAQPFAGGVFDLVLAFTSLALVPGREAREISEALRVLRRDGLLIATVLAPNRDRVLLTFRGLSAEVIQELPCGQDVGWVISR